MGESFMVKCNNASTIICLVSLRKCQVYLNWAFYLSFHYWLESINPNYTFIFRKKRSAGRGRLGEEQGALVPERDTGL